ncbi:glycerophosphoryl diester phosphodiesterase membrane domain-containing protein [Pontixanthobacter sp.]|uniref:glycerophosphoryl diester phosphodiesterase membrane domain-containing protein n=1 Tax=Pontixanthobacter sp. TaxID=2792078 RepID=UPI003C79F401
MKLDIGQAWNDATALMLGNKDMLGIVAAVFFFLPTLALSVLAPTAQLEAAAAGGSEQLQSAMMDFLAENWLLLLVYLAASTVGSLTVFALLGRRHRLTVGEALKTGLSATLPYLVATLAIGMAAGLIFAIVGVVSAAISPVVGGILGIILAALAVIALIRLLLIGPVMAAENTLNPVSAIKRSWQLVTGNTRRVFLFVVLLTIAIFVVTSVLGIIFGLLGAVVGGPAGLWAESIPAAIISAVSTVIMLSVYMSVYHGLSGSVSQAEIDTFE